MKRIRDYCIEIGDGLHGTPKYDISGDYYFINGNNLGNKVISVFDDTKRISTLEAKKIKVPLGNNTILVSINGTLGQLAFYNGEKVALGKSACYLNLKDEKYKEYIYYYMCLPCFRKYLDSVATGSTIKNIAPSQIGDFPFYINKNYIKIGTLLSTIDSKIELNNKIISELESMAKTLYDYWFLQFDFPDENGKPYKSSGGKMVYNEELKREIPEGWEVKSLSQVILSSKNGDWGNEISKAVNDVQVRCFRGADFSSIVSDYNLTAPIRFISESHRDRLLMDGDLVIEISGGSPTQATGRIGYINQSFLDRSDCAMTCSNFCKAFVPLSKNHQYWLYQIWKSYYDNGIMFNFESKTTGIKNLMFDDFCESIKVPVPCLELLQDYQNKVSAFYNLIQRSLNENSDLASLRDFLLPMLMNGQVTFKDAAEAHNN